MFARKDITEFAKMECAKNLFLNIRGKYQADISFLLRKTVSYIQTCVRRSLQKRKNSLPKIDKCCE